MAGSLARLTSPYGLPILESCLACVVREQGLFCHLQPDALAELGSIRETSFYPRGAVLFVEDQEPGGLFILCAGRAKLAATSREGKSVTLRMVMPGEVMGLSCVMANSKYQSNAETVEPSEVSMVRRANFLRFLTRYNDAALRVAEHLSMELHKAWAQTRLLALAPNARSKLAQVLLLWADRHGHLGEDGVRVPLNMTQEAIGETIGATRETVSRLLSEFQRKNWIRITGGSVLLVDPEVLRRVGTS
jgi:CRP/FNR family cyclic AMP-dependent transcriptional regulator